MEQQLDDIAEGERAWVPVLHGFYEPFQRRLATAQQEMKSVKGTGQATDLSCPTCGAPLVIKLGKRGEFLACSRYPECDFTGDLARDSEGRVQIAAQPEVAGGDAVCDKCGRPMVVKRSKFGMFLACTGYPECKNTRDLRQTTEGTLAVAEPATTDRLCDKCGRPLVMKKGRFGPFLACSGYPECKNIVKLDRSGQPKAPPQITDEKCPNCGKPMALKQGRYGPFLSCTGYPGCKTIKKVAAPAKQEQPAKQEEPVLDF
jgi:DNA topoisomerase-1